MPNHRTVNLHEKIKAIYMELRGYLEQAPNDDGGNFSEQCVWDTFNSVIDELHKITGEEFDRFKVRSSQGEGYLFASIREYRTKLSGLISWLYGKYFNYELEPFHGSPNTVIQQNQQQMQSTQVQILLDMRGFIDNKLRENLEDKEKSFLENIKEKLSSIKSISELIYTILSTGSTMGLAVDQILKLFK